MDVTRPPIETRSECTARFLDEIERAFQQIKQRYVYLDTVQILTHIGLSKADKARLASRNHPGFVDLKRRHQRENSIPLGRPKQYPWRWRILLHQPTPKAIKFLAERYREPSDQRMGHIVNRLDIALDLIAADRTHVHALQYFLDKHVTQPYRGEHVSNRVEGTTYNRQDWEGRVIARYADKPSKVDGGFNAHTDYRFFGARLCQDYCGVRRIEKLNTMDPVPLLKRACRLSVIHWKKLEKEIDKSITETWNANGRVSKRSVIAVRVNRWFARVLSHESHCVPYVRLSPADLFNAQCQDLLDLAETHFRRDGVDLDGAVIRCASASLLDGALFVRSLAGSGIGINELREKL
jgi:hypothetical protein